MAKNVSKFQNFSLNCCLACRSCKFGIVLAEFSYAIQQGPPTYIRNITKIYGPAAPQGVKKNTQKRRRKEVSELAYITFLPLKKSFLTIKISLPYEGLGVVPPFEGGQGGAFPLEGERGGVHAMRMKVC